MNEEQAIATLERFLKENRATQYEWNAFNYLFTDEEEQPRKSGWKTWLP